MFPEAFINRIKSQQYIDAGSFLDALGQPSPVSIRINRAKWNRKPLNAEPVAWCSNGFYIDRRPSFTLDPLFHSGCYYPQEASGMFLGEAFRQLTGLPHMIRVLDLCAAPGGKTTHLSSVISEDSLVVSNETISSRASVLEENVIRWGLSNTIVTRNDPSAFARLPGFFDVIVVDAPCSGEGMFSNPAAVSEWSVENTAMCSDRQKRILSDAWPSLKENGFLIYCTCTFNPAENEHNIKWLTEQFDAESFRLDVSRYPGITEINYQGITGYGFYPDRVKGEGFFLSVVRKNGRITEKETPRKATGKRAFRSTGREDTENSQRLTTFPENRILRISDELVCIPCTPDELMVLSEKLRIVRPGIRISRIVGREYLPGHELAVNTGLRKAAFPACDLDNSRALAYLRREPFKVNENVAGWFIVRYEKVNLGFAKHIGRRINNYFPVGLRIRMDIPPDAFDQITGWDTTELE
ncbi:MAG: rRNA cytosine-C5-methyltransferase [Bacteroidales bacterium]